MTDSSMTGNWFESILEDIGQVRVTAFGDFCLDAYWLIDPDESETSVETGLPVRRVRRLSLQSFWDRFPRAWSSSSQSGNL